MAAGELDHAFGERGAPEVSVKLSPHLRSALQFAAKVLPPELFVIQRRAGEISISKQFHPAQRVVDAFASDRIGEAGRVAQQPPLLSPRLPASPTARLTSRKASG